jgi:hypothetical protein
MNSDDVHESDAAWLREQRAQVEAYLAVEGVAHGGIASEPDWYEPEILAIWPVESGAAPGELGWWVVSGDVPTDYLTAAPGMDARGALASVAARWQVAASRMAQGLAPEGLRIGPPEEWRALAPMLRSRAATLAEWAADDELWS